MKLVPKLTLMFILSTSVMLGVNGFLRVRREVGLFESDRVRDHELMARVVARAALDVWKTDGPERAVEVIGELGKRTDRLKIGWRPIPQQQPSPLETQLKQLAPGHTLT